MFDVLATAIATARPGRARWRDLAKRLRHATREAAVQVGEALADAVIEEVKLAKAQLGENVGQGLESSWRTLAKKDSRPDLRRALRAQSDSNVVQLLVRMGDEVAAVVGRDIVITSTSGNRLSDDDQRIWPCRRPACKARSSRSCLVDRAEVDSLPGLTRLRKLGLAEVQVAGLSRDDVERWLATAGMAEHTDDVSR